MQLIVKVFLKFFQSLSFNQSLSFIIFLSLLIALILFLPFSRFLFFFSIQRLIEFHIFSQILQPLLQLISSSYRNVMLTISLSTVLLHHFSIGCYKFS